VAAHGGRVVALGRFRENVTGDVAPRQVLILVEWESKAAFDSYRDDPALADLHAERFRGIRPAFGYPASPDHSLKRALFDLLDAGQLGMTLTESWAMTPASSVSGLLFAHPASRYFSVGRIGQDQVADYARRRGIKLAEAERWLRPNLAYEPR